MNELQIYESFRNGVTIQSNEQLEAYASKLKSAITEKRDTIRSLNFMNFGAKVSYKQLQTIGYTGSRQLVKYTTTFEEEGKEDVVKYGLKPVYDMVLLDFWTNPSLVSLDLSNEELQKLSSSLDVAAAAEKEYKGSIKTHEAFQKVKLVFKKIQHMKLDVMKLDFVKAALILRNEPAAIAAKARLDQIHAKRDKIAKMGLAAIPDQADKELLELEQVHKAVAAAKAAAKRDVDFELKQAAEKTKIDAAKREVAAKAAEKAAKKEAKRVNK